MEINTCITSVPRMQSQNCQVMEHPLSSNLASKITSTDYFISQNTGSFAPPLLYQVCSGLATSEGSSHGGQSTIREVWNEYEIDPLVYPLVISTKMESLSHTLLGLLTQHASGLRISSHTLNLSTLVFFLFYPQVLQTADFLRFSQRALSCLSSFKKAVYSFQKRLMTHSERPNYQLP